MKTKMRNGTLAAALREFMINEDLGIQQVAAQIQRSQTTVKVILRGELVNERTLARVRRAFPSIFA